MYGHQTALENLNATTGQHSQALEELGSVVIRQAKLSDFETEASTKAMLALQAAMQVEIQKRTHAQNLAIASFAASGVVLILGALSSFLLSSKVDAINGKNSSNQTVIYRNPVRPIAR